MASVPLVQPSAEFLEAFAKRGGDRAARCYQCATCSSVCELAPANAPFPRRQVLWTQWGLVDRLVADPGPWLCHQCNDCSVRCPRDVAPGDIMAVTRALVVQHLAVPAFLGRLVGNVRASWPALIFLPILFWVVLLGVTTGLEIPHVNAALPALEGRFHYEEFVPHVLIYVVYTTITVLIGIAAAVSGLRFWKMIGAGGSPRQGSFLANLVPAIIHISTHERFATCQRGVPKRRWGHFLVMWGFVGAAVTSGFAVVYLYKEYPPFAWIMAADAPSYPVPLDHWVKWLGNLSAVALVVGGILLFVNRLAKDDKLVGATNASDQFFLMTVLGVIGTGVLTEGLRFVAVAPVIACSVYVLHLGAVMTLFVTVPYSKFAHIVYRTLAMVHQRMVESEPAVASAENAPSGAVGNATAVQQ